MIYAMDVLACMSRFKDGVETKVLEHHVLVEDKIILTGLKSLKEKLRFISKAILGFFTHDLCEEL